MKLIDKKYFNNTLLIFLCTILLTGIMLILVKETNSPQKLIGDYLESHHYSYDLAAAEIVSLGSNTYELIDPPLEPLTGTPLAKWQLYPLGHFVYYAAPLDLPPLRTIDLHLTLTEDDYELLIQHAERSGLSPEDFAAQQLSSGLL